MVPILYTERSAQESLLDAAWEAGLAPTAQLARRRRSRERLVGIAALLIVLLAAVGGAIVLGRVPSFLQRKAPPQPEAPMEHR
jgi:hypothetical protein